MEEYIISAMNNAADVLLEAGETKDEAIASMREWLENWELSDDD